jgi:phosphoribosylglycinamide formyltransferase-1
MFGTGACLFMNIAVFASGRGSNFQAILDAIRNGELPARITVALSNRADAGALDLARANSIPAIHLTQKSFSTEEAFAAALMETLHAHAADFIALAGYLKKVPASVVRQFRNRILNIHPALLPAFGGPGMFGHHVHEAVLAAGVKVSGATVHLVDEEYDHGPIVCQKCVAVSREDTPETLAQKVLNIEHEIYPTTLKAFAEGRITIQGRSVWLHF